jgi:hypothetical protein
VEHLHAEDGDLRVALVHHPLEWLNDIEQSNVRSKLRENVDVILRGHLHRSEVENVSTIGGGSLHMAAGASYQTREYPNLALLARADTDRGQILVRPLRYGDTTGRWTLDTDLFGTDDYHGTFDIALKRVHQRSTSFRTTRSSGEPGSALFLLGSAGAEAQAAYSIATCVIVDNEASLMSQLETIRRAMLQDPYFRGMDGLRERLKGGALPFDSSDLAVRLRMLTGLLEVTFEAYVCYGEKTVLSSKLAGDTLEGALGRLLFERIQARRHDTIAIELDKSLGDRVELVSKAASTIVGKLSEDPTRPVAVPTIGHHGESSLRAGIADYIARVVSGRLTDKASEDGRAFNQIRPKIRVMHDYGTDTFYTRTNPLSD